MTTIDKSEQLNELAAALSKAQAKFKHVAKDKTARIRMKAGGEYTYTYADLGSTWDMARGPLTENGLSVVQSPSFNDGWLELTTLLLHASGQYISGTMKTRADEMDVKSIGSAITYLRRYAFSAMTGMVADEDDDGSAPHTSRPATAPAHTNGNSGTPGKASQKQIAALFAIWKNNGYEGDLKEWITKSYGCGVSDLSVKQASDAIERLKPADEQTAT